MSIEISAINAVDWDAGPGHRTDGGSYLLLFPDRRKNREQAAQLVDGFTSHFKTLVLTSELPPVDRVEAAVDEIVKELERTAIKRAVVFGLGAGTAVAMALAVAQPRLVRRVVLLDATTRMRPRLLERAVDRIEEFLPLGLPLRPLNSAYDARPSLHRIHAPTLVLTQPHAGSFLREQSALIADRIPNAWLVPLIQPARESTGRISDEVVNRLMEFVQVPVKAPQKRSKLAAKITPVTAPHQ